MKTVRLLLKSFGIVIVVFILAGLFCYLMDTHPGIGFTILLIGGTGMVAKTLEIE